jgi:hypothetical protein
VEVNIEDAAQLDGKEFSHNSFVCFGINVDFCRQSSSKYEDLGGGILGQSEALFFYLFCLNCIRQCEVHIRFGAALPPHSLARRGPALRPTTFQRCMVGVPSLFPLALLIQNPRRLLAARHLVPQLRAATAGFWNPSAVSCAES